VDVRIATHVRPELERCWNVAVRGIEESRGGEAYLLDVIGEAASDNAGAALVSFVNSQQVVEAVLDEDVLGFCVVSDLLIVALYVLPEFRRRGVARLLLDFVFDLGDPPCDAWVLPGDRESKSLYENLGWKARLLTMGDE